MRILKENNIHWRIILIEKLVKMSRFDTNEAVMRFSNKLKKYGIDDELRSLGAQEGDSIHILDFEFEFKEWIDNKKKIIYN